MTEERQCGPSRSSPTMRILGRLLLAETAEASGLNSLSFDNGTEALDAALSYGAAIVLLDVEMPGMDGYEVCRRLRAEPRFTTTPIVMVTGHEDSDRHQPCVRGGRDRFHFQAGQLGAAAAPPRLHPAQCAAAERIERLAYFDPLTGASEPATLSRDGGAAVRGGCRSRRGVAVLYMDLNSFKRVNDTFGHSVGDAVLQNVGRQAARS